MKESEFPHPLQPNEQERAIKNFSIFLMWQTE